MTSSPPASLCVNVCYFRTTFPSPPTPTLSNVSCNHDEVLKLLSTHKINTASGPDGISSVMLRGTAASISPALTALFNLSLKKSIVPDEWKKTNVTPILKASNYRPISPIANLQICLHNSVIDLLLEHNLGFRPKSSTQDALLTITRDLCPPVGRWLLYFFDIKKEFDSVPHSANIGITGEPHQWFANYLTGRYQRVVLDGYLSLLVYLKALS